MTHPRAVTVTIKRRFAADREAVFDAWLEPTVARCWLFTSGATAREVSIDARDGGRFRIVDQRKDEDIAHEGVFVELKRPESLRLRFWMADLPDDIDIVTATLTREDDACVMTVAHQLAPAWSSFREQTRIIWQEMFDRLAAALAA